MSNGYRHREHISGSSVKAIFKASGQHSSETLSRVLNNYRILQQAFEGRTWVFRGPEAARRSVTIGSLIWCIHAWRTVVLFSRLCWLKDTGAKQQLVRCVLRASSGSGMAAKADRPLRSCQEQSSVDSPDPSVPDGEMIGSWSLSDRRTGQRSSR